ncbi:MAG: hypothetical protein HUJ53_04550 [Holdemanella sp.]|nr:hypothetical protein [Holdemanella sp.]
MSSKYIYREHPVYKGYYFSEKGKVYRKYKNGKRKYLHPFLKNNDLFIKVNNSKTIKVSRLIMESFHNRILNENECIVHKDMNRLNNDIGNLYITDKHGIGKMTGYMSKRRYIIMIDDEGKAKHIFKSSREAADKLYINRQTVCDYCNGITKKKLYNLKWYDDVKDKYRIKAKYLK